MQVALSNISSARSRRRDEALEKILDCALGEFARAGVDNVSLETIARNAAVSKQVIYYNFGGRQGLYEAVIERYSAGAADRLAATDFSRLEPIEAIRHLFGIVFDVQNATPVEVLIYECKLRHPLMARRTARQRKTYRVFEEIVERGVATGVLSPQIEPRKCFALASMMLRGLFAWAKIWADSSTPHEIHDQMTEWRESVLDAIVLLIRRNGGADGSH